MRDKREHWAKTCELRKVVHSSVFRHSETATLMTASYTVWLLSIRKFRDAQKVIRVETSRNSVLVLQVGGCFALPVAAHTGSLSTTVNIAPTYSEFFCRHTAPSSGIEKERGMTPRVVKVDARC